VSDLTKSSIGGALWAASVPPGPQQLPLGLTAAGYSAAASAARGGPEVPPLGTETYDRAGAVPDRRLNDLGDALGVVADWRAAGVDPGRYVPGYAPEDRRAR
jgi:hypothetical protein